MLAPCKRSGFIPTTRLHPGSCAWRRQALNILELFTQNRFQAFETVSQGVNVVRSVAVVRGCSYSVPAPPREAFSPLGNPLRKNIPAPHSDFIENFFGNLDVSESTAELFVFKNARLRKRLDVYTRTAAKRALRKSRNLYGLFLLQIIDM